MLKIGHCLIISLLVSTYSDLASYAQTDFEPLNPIRIITVFIEDKTEDQFFVNERSFIVTSSTQISDINGTSIQFSQVPIPCNSEIQVMFESDKDPICLDLKVK